MLSLDNAFAASRIVLNREESRVITLFRSCHVLQTQKPLTTLSVAL
jgi:hypothetical protein